MHERRNNFRNRCYLGGRINFDQRFSDVDCLIRNLSQSGARLVFNDSPVLPTNFTLNIPLRNEQHAATLMWRREKEAGIAFTRPHRSDNIIPLDDHLEMRANAAQQAVLRKRIAQIAGKIDA